MVGRVRQVEAVPAQGARARDAGVVDQDIDRLAGREERLGGAPHRAEIRDVQRHPLRRRRRETALERAQHGPGPLLGAGREHHPIAAGREGLDQSTADARIRSGDEERPRLRHPPSTG